MKGTIQVDDPEILDIDPVQKLWMFNQWVGDQIDSAELAKNHAYLLASFDHPEAVKELVGAGDVHQSTDEEFEESSKMVREMSLISLAAPQPQETTKKAKRKRRLTLKEER